MVGTLEEEEERELAEEEEEEEGRLFPFPFPFPSGTFADPPPLILPILLTSFCHARVAQSSDSVFPVPVGDSSRALDELCSAVTTHSMYLRWTA